MVAATVSHRSTVCAPSLNCTCVTLTLADTGYVYTFSFAENVSLNFIANVKGDFVKSEFLKNLLNCYTALCEVTLESLCYVLLFYFSEDN